MPNSNDTLIAAVNFAAKKDEITSARIIKIKLTPNAAPSISTLLEIKESLSELHIMPNGKLAWILYGKNSFAAFDLHSKLLKPVHLLEQTLVERDFSTLDELSDSNYMVSSDWSFSPDGSQVAFSALDKASNAYIIYVANIDGSNQQRLSEDKSVVLSRYAINGDIMVKEEELATKLLKHFDYIKFIVPWFRPLP